MKSRYIVVSAASLLGALACSAAPPDAPDAEEAAGSAESALATQPPGGGGGGGVIDPGPTYCPTVDPLCALCPGTEVSSGFDEALQSAGCAPEKIHVNADQNLKTGAWVQASCTGVTDSTRICKGGITHWVSYCPNSRAVAAIVANASAYGVSAGSSTTLCDKCLFRPASGYTWVYWNKKVNCPNCGSGCKPPAW